MASVVARKRFIYRKIRSIRWTAGWIRPLEYDVFLWHFSEQRWIKLSGAALTKDDAAEFLRRFNNPKAAAVLWPAGVAFHSVEMTTEGGSIQGSMLA